MAVFAERVVALTGETKTHAASLPLLDPRSADEETMTLETTLKQWNADLINDEGLPGSVAQEFIDTDWFGLPPATEEEIGAAETRLGVRLPASYREFLLFANGWVYPGNDMDFPGSLRSCSEIGWFKDEDADWIRAWIDTDPGIPVSDDEYFVYGDDQDPVIMRREYLASCLKISESSEGGVYLLNPNVLRVCS
ncbi:SMI1/KNR4 family protein [uncultured Thiocystis sp.]|uniref:SMI1/KNR4 family protein n=1 Tax=uncultured Thiocystis sp. TaxID=1202134 RepID=UPI0025E07038|nr:SMI1/KNR4 family protein [uncultured Thiocystis sp.]